MDLWKEVDLKFQQGEIESAIRFLETSLAAESVNRFKGLIGTEFSNPPSAVLTGINDFLSSCLDKFDVQAVYLEMNGFDVNYKRWFFDFFAFDRYLKYATDLDWLCDWQSEEWPEITLTGLEKVQEDFEWYHENQIHKESRFDSAHEAAALLVMCKFVRLIADAIRSGSLIKPVPVLATAHDFEIIGKFEPE